LKWSGFHVCLCAYRKSEESAKQNRILQARGANHQQNNKNKKKKKR
jgi:hypothetical protein